MSFKKRWRYVAAFDERAMLCAAVVRIGLLGQAFWALWDRERGEFRERTRLLLPGRRPEVAMKGREVEVGSEDVEIRLHLGQGRAIEATCRTAGGAATWTRKLAGVSVEGLVRVGSRELELRCQGVEDDSAGRHPRRTSWLWSAGVGEARDGRSIAWNLVSGINDPERGSERAIWVEGKPSEPAPVAFEGRDGLEEIRFADGSVLEFRGEAERARSDSLGPLLRTTYRAPFGAFAGSLAGIEIESGLGVMESHDALW